MAAIQIGEFFASSVFYRVGAERGGRLTWTYIFLPAIIYSTVAWLQMLISLTCP